MTTHAPEPPKGQRKGPKCGRHRRRSDELCTMPAGWGTDHVGHGACKLHGGSSPTGRKHAQVAQAREAVSRHALPLDVDPITALLDEVKRAAGAVAWLWDQVCALDPDGLIRGTRSIKRVNGPDGSTTTTEVGPAVHLWWQLWGQERDRLRVVSRDALAAGIEERRVRMAEHQGALLADGLEWLLRELDMASDPRAADAVLRMLRALDTGHVPQ